MQRLVNFQTVLCYGRPDRVPIPVDHPRAPFTSYGISKTAGEQYLAAGGLPWVSLRLANVTGPRLAIGPIPTFYKRLKAGQNCFCTEACATFSTCQIFFPAIGLVPWAKVRRRAHSTSRAVRGMRIREIYDLVRSHLGLPADPQREGRASRRRRRACRGARSLATMTSWLAGARRLSRRRSGACWPGTTSMALLTSTPT